MTTFYLDPEQGADVTRDASPFNQPLVLNGTTPPSINSTVTKFGQYALNLVGASSDAALTTISGATPYLAQFGAGAFTIEVWAYWATHSAVNYEEIIAMWASTTNLGWTLEMTNTGTLQFLYSTTGTNQITVGAAYNPPTGQWIHLAVDRDDTNTLRIYAGGTVIASAAAAGTLFASTRQLMIGNNGNVNAKFPGHIGGVRITKGVARYAGAFTPPTAAFATSTAGDPYFAKTTLLLNFDTNGSGTSFANRWRTFLYGANGSRLTAGDTVRVIASPDPTPIGNASWTSNSRTVTLASSVTAMINTCELPWNAAANVTATTTGTNPAPKEGTYRGNLVLGGSFTTGLIAYSGVGSQAPTVTSRTASLLGAGTLTALSSTHTDELMTTVNLPFAVTYNGSAYTTLYVSSNSFVTFGTSQQRASVGTGTQPSVPNIQISAADHASERVYAGSEDGNATFRIRFEGSNVYSASSFDMVWEMTFTAATPGVIKLDIGTNAAKAIGGSGCSSGSGYVGTFDAGLENVGYTITAPTGGTDLSGYQQVSFWLGNSGGVVPPGSLSLRLCSDSNGATTVNTLPIPPIPSTGNWVPVTVDLGAPLGSAIKSVALYADTAPGAITLMLDNIIACKASSSPDALTLNSLIGKVHNLGWTASTAYGVGDNRRPSQPKRTGFSYRVTVAGTSGATEPAWPQEIGVSVADGGVTWLCQELEDTWYPIGSISGTTVQLDGPVLIANAGSGNYGYQGTAETVATYKREPMWVPSLATSSGANGYFALQKNGTDSAWMTYSGGWNRADMTVQSGESWLTGGNGNGMGIHHDSAPLFQSLSHFGLTRFTYGMYATTTAFVKWSNIHVSGCSLGMIAAGRRLIGTNLMVVNGSSYGLDCSNIPSTLTCVTCNGNNGNSPQSGVGIGPQRTRMNYVVAKGNAGSGVMNNSNGRADAEIRNLSTANNNSYGYNNGGYGSTVLVCANIAEATPFSSLGQFADGYIYSQKHGGVAGVHLVTSDSGTVRSVTDVRHTASGIAWRFNPTSTDRGASYPLRLSVAKIACAANVPKTVTIWTRRDNANIKGVLNIDGGQLAGLGQALSVACAPTVNSWEQSAALTFTPTEAGVVEITFLVYDGINTTNNFWIDDLTVT